MFEWTSVLHRGHGSNTSHLKAGSHGPFLRIRFFTRFRKSDRVNTLKMDFRHESGQKMKEADLFDQ